MCISINTLIQIKISAAVLNNMKLQNLEGKGIKKRKSTNTLNPACMVTAS